MGNVGCISSTVVTEEPIRNSWGAAASNHGLRDGRPINLAIWWTLMVCLLPGATTTNITFRYPQRTHILKLLGPKTLFYGAFGLF